MPDLGENRDQEARVKARELRRRPRWHFVGRLQRNKAGSVAAYAAVVHSRRPAASWSRALANGVRRAGRDPLDVLVQVSIDGDPDRGGAPAGDVVALADAAAAPGLLRPAGVMAVAPIGRRPGRGVRAAARGGRRAAGRAPGGDGRSRPG